MSLPMMENRITTATAMGKELPPELVTEILVCLPVKSLCRFRCVSKSMFRLLTADNSFIQLQLDRAIKNKITSLLLWNHEYGVDRMDDFYHVNDHVALDSVVKLKLPFEKLPNSSLALLGICNGLLYLSNYSSCWDGKSYSSLYVWNPLTGDHISIQFPPIPFDFPNDTTTSFGFGYCQSVNEFKAIRILSAETKSQSHVSVYTLGAESCRILESFPYKVCNHAALVRGAFHWLGIKHGSTSYAIVCFRIKEEVFLEISLPFICRDRYYFTIAELSGSLHMYHNDPARSVEVWVMKEYGEVDSWTKLFKIGKSTLPGLFWHQVIPRGVTKKGDIILQIKGLEERDSSLALYNPKTNSVDSLKKFPYPFCKAYDFIGSLTSPRLINGAMVLPREL